MFRTGPCNGSVIEVVFFRILVAKQADIFHFGPQLFAADTQKNSRLTLIKPGFFEGAEHGLRLHC